MFKPISKKATDPAYIRFISHNIHLSVGSQHGLICSWERKGWVVSLLSRVELQWISKALLRNCECFPRLHLFCSPSCMCSWWWQFYERYIDAIRTASQ